MDLREMVKVRLRVMSAAFDEAEIQPLIEACMADLARVGVTAEESRPLIRQAVVFYCKAHFGFSKDAERYEKAYENLRDAMAQSGGYGGGGSAVS